MTWRRWTALAISSAFIASAVFVGTWALAKGGSEWSAAVQAAASVILVAVTLIYVIHTRRLAELQAQEPKLQEQFRAVTELRKLLGENRRLVDGAVQPFPLQDGAPHFDFSGQGKQLRQLRNKIGEIRPRLPLALRQTAQELEDGLAGAVIEHGALAEIPTDSVHRSDGYDWASAKDAFAATGRPPEQWESVARGERSYRMKQRADELRGEIDRLTG